MSTQSIAALFGLSGVPAEAVVQVFDDVSNPYIPSVNSDYVFRRDFVRELIAFLTFPSGDSLYVTGPTGSGKTSGVTETLGRMNWPMQSVTAHGNLELNDLIGHYALVSRKEGEQPSMQFVYGALATAMREGHVLLINEIDLMNPAELSGLNDVLEGRPLVISANGGEVIKPHANFRVIVTGNSTGAGDATGLYQGVLMQNMAAMDRYRFTVVDYPAEADEVAIVTKAAPGIVPTVAQAMVKLANEVRSAFVGGDNHPGQLSLTMSTRTLVRWAKLTLVHRKAEKPLEYALQQSFLARANEVEKVAVIQIAKDVFGQSWA